MGLVWEGHSLLSLSPDLCCFWECDVLLATPSVGRVSDVATIDDSSLVRLGDAIFPAKVLGVLALLLAENPQIN